MRKGNRGLAIILGDIFPGNAVSHLPVLLMESGVLYLFVPFEQDLEAVESTKWPISWILLKSPLKALSLRP